MELFSKRYKQADKNFLEERIRNRLLEEIKFISSSDEYIERFLLVYNEEKNIFCLNHDSLKELGMREIGNSIVDYVDLKNCLSYSNKKDAVIFDLLEILIIFSKQEKRSIVITRINYILEEEDTPFLIHEYLFFNKNITGVRSVVPFIKNKSLKDKLEEFFLTNIENPNYQVLSRITADLIQNIFSSPKDKKNTKNYSENLCKMVSQKWTSEKNVLSLTKLLNDAVKNSKDLANQISNIRHTDQNTIPVNNSNFYKLVTYNCMSIAELVILSLPEKFISTEEVENIKNNYLNKYKINKNAIWVLKEDSNIIEDLPF
ncbi:MAG: hypothetical protein WC414_00645 [Patescibacteria group bacterium]